jgi:heat shock protein HslJ
MDLQLTNHRPHTHRLIVLALGAIVVASLAACTSSANNNRNATEGVSNVEQQLMAHQWLLDRQASSLRIGDSHPITIVFGPQGLVSGVAPCNTYRGTFVVHQNLTVTISRITTSGRPCQGQHRAAENEYFHALGVVRDVQPTNPDQLKLARGNTRLVYNAAGFTPPTSS